MLSGWLQKTFYSDESRNKNTQVGCGKISECLEGQAMKKLQKLDAPGILKERNDRREMFQKDKCEDGV